MLMKTHLVLTLQRIPKFGQKTIAAILDNAQQDGHAVNDVDDLLGFLETHWQILTKSVKIQRALPTKAELNAAEEEAKQIIDASEREGVKVIAVSDASYPNRLRSIPNPPTVLYVKGKLDILSQRAVAVVGTREPTSIGARIAERLGELLSQRGFVVVSGLALGCDTLAHEGSLKESGKTIAVLAHGLTASEIYPKKNHDLAMRILENGAWVSEYPIGTKLHASHFVQRDRIQSGLSNAVAVVETDTDGGTMQTAKFCVEQNRILACYLHRTHEKSEKSRGNEQLLSNGALSLGTPEDIELFIQKMYPKRAIIFDLDMTLIDSSEVEPLRQNKQWKDIYPQIPSLHPYPNINPLLKHLKAVGVKIAIVTSSPKPYSEKIIQHFQWHVDVIVAYHDTKEHKPHPAPILEALNRLAVKSSEVISVGDAVADIEASHKAGVDSIAAFWGTSQPERLAESHATYQCRTVDDFTQLIHALFGTPLS